MAGITEMATEIMHLIAYSPTSPLTPSDVLSLALTCHRMHETLLGDEYAIDSARSLGQQHFLAKKGWWRALKFSLTRAGRASMDAIAGWMCSVPEEMLEEEGEVRAFGRLLQRVWELDEFSTAVGGASLSGGLAGGNETVIRAVMRHPAFVSEWAREGLVTMFNRVGSGRNDLGTPQVDAVAYFFSTLAEVDPEFNMRYRQVYELVLSMLHRVETHGLSPDPSQPLSRIISAFLRAPKWGPIFAEISGELFTMTLMAPPTMGAASFSIEEILADPMTDPMSNPSLMEALMVEALGDRQRETAHTQLFNAFANNDMFCGDDYDDDYDDY